MKEHTEESFRVPCGQCIECRLKQSREWAIRCVHEASLHEESWFATMTLAEEYLPPDLSLDRRLFPLFMKKLRKRFGKVRYFHAGEYGEDNGRPHYHALLFGLRLADVRQCGISRSGYPVFESEALSDVWAQGIVQLGRVSFESAQYVARYCVKKYRGREDGKPDYGIVDHSTGCWVPRTPEYVTMSRNPGLGKGWWQKYRSEVYRDDAVPVRGGEMGPPRYYDKKEEEVVKEAAMDVIKLRRMRKHGARCTIANGYTWRTNAAREVIAINRLKHLMEVRV